MRYGSQTLLFNETQPVALYKDDVTAISPQFYEKGYAIISDIQTPDEALDTLQKSIASIDAKRLPFLSRFIRQMKLAKADVIPVCEDIVSSSYQVLHFDMGQPFLAKEIQTMYFITALYAPLDGESRNAQTRILPLKGLLSSDTWGGKDVIQEKVMRYVAQHGDGWADTNTYRLSCFARLLDAISDTEELAKEKDKMVGHWFLDTGKYDTEASWSNECTFYAKRGIDLQAQEHRVQLQPGQMLLFDNTRVVHGRIGSRKAKELYQFLLGVESVDTEGIEFFMDHLFSELTATTYPVV